MIPNPTLFERERGVTEIAVRNDLTHLAIACDSDGRLRALRALAAGDVPLFLLKLAPDGFRCVVRSANADAAASVVLNAGFALTRTDRVAMVSTIAGTMRDLSGVMARICDVLIEARISVLQTGDAYDAVHCLVSEADAPGAVEALRRTFGIDAGGNS
ncbi:MAG: ACT domain-containing protein [Armatimonadaceae bacterium]|jgi:aspartokinase